MYAYTPLDGNTKEIRLLRLQPGGFKDRISMHLHHDTLSAESTVHYEALSYVWGDTTSLVDVTVLRAGKTPQRLRVTETLAAALRHLRDEREVRTLWVDAICINQNSIPERNQQVPLMGDIYRRASRVLAWLGPEEEGSSRALEYMKLVASSIVVDWDAYTSASIKRSPSDTGGLDWLDDKSLAFRVPKPECDFLYDLFRRQWFERLWIRQEAALNVANTLVLCGEASIPWQTFLNASICISTHGLLADVPDETFYHSRMRLIYQIGTCARNANIYNLRHHLRGSRCSDQRDKVFAILSLLQPDDLRLGIVPDYAQSMAQIYQDVTVRWIKEYDSIALLSSCQLVDEPPSTIPSWVPDWSIDFPSQPLSTVANFHDFWGGNVPFSFQGAGTLRVFGVQFATLDSVFDSTRLDVGRGQPVGRAALKGMMAFLSRQGSRIGGQGMAETVCRTLFADDFAETHFPPRPDLTPSFEDCMQYLSHINTVDDLSSRPPGDETLLVATIWHHLRGRVVGVTREGYPGLVPETAKVGDIVCSVIGCTEPLVLRPSAEGYVLVGVCCIPGFMAHESMFGSYPDTYSPVKWVSSHFTSTIVGYLKKGTQEPELQDPRRGWREFSAQRDLYLDGKDGKPLDESEKLELWSKAGVALQPFDLV